MIYRSSMADRAIPDLSVAQAVLGPGLSDDLPALIDGVSGAVTTRGALIEGMRRFAGGLAARGIGPGRVVALMAPNCPEFALVFYGTGWAGATLTTANPGYTAPELRHQLNDSGAVLLVVPSALLPVAQEAVTGTGVTEIVLLDEGAGATGWADFLGAPLAAQVPLDPATAIVALPYSSGTTGLPKGVMLTHRNLVANAVQIDACAQVRQGEVTLAVLPFFHIYGMEVLLNLHLGRGAALVTLPRFDLAAALRLVATHRMERLYLVPPVVLALAKHPLVDEHDLSSLRSIVSGAAPLGAELTGACEARLGCTVMQGYGMTEASPVTHFSKPDAARAGSGGRLVPNTEARIVDPETGLDVPPGETGELLVRGPQVMVGYLKNPAATAKTLDAEGWLHTGDLGRVEADGSLFIVDRVKELIKVKGFQVAPAELEALLLGHPAIADCAVIGRADDEAGEVPVAFVVPRAGSALTEAEVMAHVAGQVARYKALRGVRFVEAIPKSASGKILRRVLRDQA
jgi:acyl-CoA synthetase (AMP-forming)/AMP-acid ligase II